MPRQDWGRRSRITFSIATAAARSDAVTQRPEPNLAWEGRRHSGRRNPETEAKLASAGEERGGAARWPAAGGATAACRGPSWPGSTAWPSPRSSLSPLPGPPPGSTPSCAAWTWRSPSGSLLRRSNGPTSRSGSPMRRKE
jgi:hypothetical protein